MRSLICLLWLFIPLSEALSRDTALKLSGTSVFVAAGLSLSTNSLFAHYETAEDIPKAHIQQKREIYGEVTRVVDGDTVRFAHKSLFRGSPSAGKTINLRIAAVDAPETAKFGNPGMPFSSEATEFTKEAVLNRNVRVKMLSKDRYGRLVAKIQYKEKGKLLPPWSSDLSLRLVQEGLAVVYEGGGAQYDGQKDVYTKAAKKAQSQKKGLWSLQEVESPAEYKKRTNTEKKRT